MVMTLFPVQHLVITHTLSFHIKSSRGENCMGDVDGRNTATQVRIKHHQHSQSGSSSQLHLYPNCSERQTDPQRCTHLKSRILLTTRSESKQELFISLVSVVVKDSDSVKSLNPNRVPAVIFFLLSSP